MIWYIAFFIFTYTLLIFFLALGFLRTKEFKTIDNTSKTTFSIIIPFRNEAENLPTLLTSISKLNYNKQLVEFLFVDDASTDDSVKVIEKFISISLQKSNTNHTNIDIISNQRKSNSPKKDAISTAISIAKNSWIVTTDADCKLPPNWLNTLDAFIQEEKPKMVVAPVKYDVKNSFFEKFQQLDFLSLQGATLGGFGLGKPFLCNGANLAYQKEAFLSVAGFKNNDNIASGDDIFLLEKFLAVNTKNVGFLKSKKAIVTTFPVKNWKLLLQQRIRWAAKSSSYALPFSKLVGLLVFCTNLSLVILFFSLNFSLFFRIFFVKITADLFLFMPTIHFFEQKKSFLVYYLPSSFLYPFFSVFVVFNSIFFKYDWKGRSFKK